VQEILREIKQGQLAPVYVIHGPEVMWQAAVYRALHERVMTHGLGEWNWSLYQGNKEFTVEELIADLGTMPWGGGEKIIVVRDAQMIPTAELDTVVTWLQNHEDSPCLALFFNKIDSRLKVIKSLLALGREIRCESLQGEALLRHVTNYCITQGKTIKREAAQLFVDMVGSDLLLIANELDKLLSFIGNESEITVQAVEAVTSLSPGEAEQNAIFAMTDHIAAGDQKAALRVLERLFDSGENPFRILPVIERQLRLLLAAKTRVGTLEETAQVMGERSAYPLRKASQYAGSFSIEQLYEGFGAVVEADREMKLGTPGEAVLRDLIIRLTLLRQGSS